MIITVALVECYDIQKLQQLLKLFVEDNNKETQKVHFAGLLVINVINISMQ